METIDWEKSWKETQSGSMFSKHPADERKWQRFWDEEAAGFLEGIIADREYYGRIADYLEREGVFQGGDDVLDIACGPGTYSLLFAEKASEVTALDPSSGMLSTLAGEAARRGLTNIKTVRSRWEDFPREETYDLVFTALSPAIKGPRDLLGLEDVSRRSCCYVTFGDGGKPLLRDEMWELLTGEKTGDDAFNVSYPLNLLHSRGRKPNVRFFDQERDARIPSKKLIDNNARFFGLFVDMDVGKKDKIRRYIESRSKNGFYETHVKKSLAVLHWEVPGTDD